MRSVLAALLTFASFTAFTSLTSFTSFTTGQQTPSSSNADGSLSPPLSPRNANYSIDARLDPATRTITASEVILWRNTTTKSTDELQLHLYLERMARQTLDMASGSGPGWTNVSRAPSK